VLVTGETVVRSSEKLVMTGVPFSPGVLARAGKAIVIAASTTTLDTTDIARATRDISNPHTRSFLPGTVRTRPRFRRVGRHLAPTG
jgi:hypothetical protein